MLWARSKTLGWWCLWCVQTEADEETGGCKTMHFLHKNQGGATEVTGCSRQHCGVKVVGIIAVVPAMRHSFQAWWILCHSSAFSSWGWLKQLPNRLTGIFGSPGESLSGRLIGYSRIANLCYLTAWSSRQNQVMSCNLRGSTHKRMHATLPLVQRGVINLISLKLQCSNKLRDSSHSSNCQYEIYQCKLWGNG